MSLFRLVVLCGGALGLALTPVLGADFLLDQVEILDPDLSAVVFEMVCDTTAGNCSPCGVEGAPGFYCLDKQYGAFDAAGSFYEVLHRNPNAAGDAWEVTRTAPSGVKETIVRAPKHGPIDCPGQPGEQHTNFRSISIDNANGILLLAMTSQILGSTCPQFGDHQDALVAIGGLPKLYDIQLSYETPSSITWNAPVHPEGLDQADSFDLYAGDLDGVADLATATALQCSVPSGRDVVPGERFQEVDPLPTPTVGSGNYYLATVSRSGAIRGGRSRLAGQLQGRDMSALPACNP